MSVTTSQYQSSFVCGQMSVCSEHRGCVCVRCTEHYLCRQAGLGHPQVRHTQQLMDSLPDEIHTAVSGIQAHITLMLTETPISHSPSIFPPHSHAAHNSVLSVEERDIGLFGSSLLSWDSGRSVTSDEKSWAQMISFSTNLCHFGEGDIQIKSNYCSYPL